MDELVFLFNVEENSESKLDLKRDVTHSGVAMLVNSNFVVDDCSVTSTFLNCYCKLMGVTGLAYFSIIF